MKIKVEYSESIQVSEGLWRKIGIEIENEILANSPGESQVEDTHKAAKEYVQRWHKEAQPAGNLYPDGVISALNPHNSVIDRSIERLEILIDDAKTVEELNKVHYDNAEKIHLNESLINCLKNKMEELSK